MKKKVVVTASTAWYPFNFRLNTIKSLVENNYDVYIVAPHSKYLEKLNDMNVTTININIDRGGINPIKDFMTICSYFNIYKNIRPDFVLNFTPKSNIYSTIAARFFTKNIINNISGLGAGFSSSGVVYYISFILYYFSQRLAKKVYFQNVENKTFFVDRNIVSKNKVDVLPGSGVDLNRFGFSEYKEKDKIEFLFCGRFLYSKGIGDYVNAAKALKKKYSDRVVFNVVGFIDTEAVNGVKKQDLEQWINEGIINYLGETDDIVPILRHCNCIVLPSYYPEGVPKSLLEAGAIGLPILTTRMPGCKETVVDGVNGFLFDKDSFVNCLEQFISLDFEQRKKMGYESRRHMEKCFDENIGIDKYLSELSVS